MARCSNSTLRINVRNVVTFFLLVPGLAFSSMLLAQGTTTAAIRGTIRTQDASVPADTRVRIVNVSSGYAIETHARNGTFLVQGLMPGGPYRLVASSLGYLPQSYDGITLNLGEQRELAFTLLRIAGQLDRVTVRAGSREEGAPNGGGVGTYISDSALHRLPALNRDLYDFVRLVPQAGTRFGLTGAGANFRYNNYLIDGVSDRQLQGNNVMGGALGGKTISIEAVKEIQVLLSPYDARYGDFTGMLVNAVTRSGTNTPHGSVYGYARNESLARQNSFVGDSPYSREQFGFSAGGPIVRNRAHFFIAPEFQHSSAPTPGPYVGQDASITPPLPVLERDVARFASRLRDHGLDAGDGSRVTMLNPAMTLFGRLDVALPEWRSRLVFVENFSNVDVTRFSRTDQLFPLTSNAFTLRIRKQSAAIQIFTQISTAGFNEIVVSYMDRPMSGTDYTHSPTVMATAPTVSGGRTVQLIAGPPARAGGLSSASKLSEIADHFLFQAGSHHTIGLGLRTEIFRFHSSGVPGQFGVWRFSSLAALSNNTASSYSIARDFGGGEAGVRGIQPGFYVSDDWRVADNLSMTLGIRGDDMLFSSTPAYNPAVDSIYHRRTSDYPASHLDWSPRLGFSWSPRGPDIRIRGGAGWFVGPPPLGWVLGPVRSNGDGVRTLTCSSSNIPKFTLDAAHQPQQCSDGKDFSGGPVALVDRNLRMAKSFRTSLAVERRLPFGFEGSLEALYSRVRSDFLFVNSNLKGAQGVDAHGRILYGARDAFGSLRPVLIGDRRYTEVIDLRNHSLGHSWSATAQLDRSFSKQLELHAAYTWSRTRDVQSLTNTSAVSPSDIWAGGRPLSGRHEDLSTGISSFEIPNRVVVTASYSAPWTRWKTDLSFYYIGESGSPFTYNDSSATAFGDLNADGTNANDPIYVPRDATNASEIMFDSAGQGEAFEQFIRSTPCLQRQRGSIVARNSCRGAWVSTSNASLRQSLQEIRGHDVSLQVEVFNLLNLLHSSWGLFKVPNDRILEQKGETSIAPFQPVFHFNAASVRSSTQNLESGYQLQLSLRYRF